MLVGTNPAVITRTVFSLTKESSNSIPDEIVALTKSSGKEAIIKELFQSGVWDGMLKYLEIPPGKCAFSRDLSCIRVIPSLDAKSDNEEVSASYYSESAADLMMESLRQFTENQDTKLILTFDDGGGAMSVLAALAMSMLARTQDKICHLGINPPFDNFRLEPKFYYPSGIIHKLADDSNISSNEAKIQLRDIPFARIRHLFQKEHLRL
ncbi:MAG TPA: CRISPR-associated ring nuclease Csm6, partial [Victivallales bacterium]|nr:CRISPR-associated ring nuclease Csm6 [Victivallales bacterium]